MDEAYKQHSHHAKRKNRSTTNLNRLTLAPLTTKLPFDEDTDAFPRDSDYPPPPRTSSYLQGKSAPTTPRLLTHSPGTSRTPSSRRSLAPHANADLPKSKSASHLAASGGQKAKRRGKAETHGNGGPEQQDAAPGSSDGDWLMRAGVLMSTEAREFKGQAWLTSRESSTSLAGTRDAEEEVLERELARERGLATREQSRRGSADLHEGLHRSARVSRAGSRSGSRSRIGGTRSQMLTPMEGRVSEEGGYFGRHHGGDAGAEAGEGSEELEAIYAQGPDFVNLDEKLEALEQDTSQEDEAMVRKLVKGERAGTGSWFGWSLFSVEENPEDSDAGEEDGDADSEVNETQHQQRSQQREGRGGSSARHFEGVTNAPKEQIAPPDPTQGGWGDAAWLLSVASKVIL